MNVKTNTEHFTDEEIKNNHEAFLKRMAHYKKHGMNQTLLRESIIRQIDHGSSSILEIGTGKGYLTALLSRHYDRIVSVDTSDEDLRAAMINASQSDGRDKINFITADAGSLDFDDRSFDVVVSAFTFHHLDLPFKVLREMIRLADKQIIISDFSPRGFNVVEQVHRQEGSSHEKKPVDFDIIGVYLKEFNFDVRLIEDEWQTIYSARRR